MKPWLQDVPEQLALALLLAKGSIGCGERIGLIVADNAVEYMMVAYVESHRRLVGPGKAITRKEWNEKKRYFESLVDFVSADCAGLTDQKNDILNFHELRNSLYHTGQPVSVKGRRVREYADLAKSVFNILFTQNLTLGQLDHIASQNQAALAPAVSANASSPVVFEKVDSSVRLKTGVSSSTPDAICLLLYGFTRETSRTPSFRELKDSLARSGLMLGQQVLSSRLYELRKRGFVSSKDLSLTVRGRSHVLARFAVE